MKWKVLKNTKTLSSDHHLPLSVDLVKHICIVIHGDLFKATFYIVNLAKIKTMLIYFGAAWVFLPEWKLIFFFNHYIQWELSSKFYLNNMLQKGIIGWGKHTHNPTVIHTHTFCHSWLSLSLCYWSHKGAAEGTYVCSIYS